MRQLSLAWIQYAHDSNDRITYASESRFGGGTVSPQTDPYVWVKGLIDFNPMNPSNWDIDVDVKKSPLWTYCANAPEIWRCPADRSTIVPAFGRFQGQRVPRVRSMAMSIWVGGFGGELRLSPFPGVSSPPWQLFLKLNDLPNGTLLFWDEREDTIGLGNFFADMTGYPDSPWQTQFSQDLPAARHNQAGAISFADGAAQIRRWLDPRTMPPIQASGWSPVLQSPNNRDIIWLQQHATRKM